MTPYEEIERARERKTAAAAYEKIIATQSATIDRFMEICDRYKAMVKRLCGTSEATPDENH